MAEEKGHLVTVLTIERTHYAFSQKIATGMNIFSAFKNIYEECLFAITLIRAGVAVQGPLVATIILSPQSSPQGYMLAHFSSPSNLDQAIYESKHKNFTFNLLPIQFKLHP